MLIQLHAASYAHTLAKIVKQILLAVISQWSIYDVIFHIQLHDPLSVINRFYADLHRRQFITTHQMELLHGTACGLTNMHVYVLTRCLFMKSYSLVYAHCLYPCKQTGHSRSSLQHTTAVGLTRTQRPRPHPRSATPPIVITG